MQFSSPLRRLLIPAALSLSVIAVAAVIPAGAQSRKPKPDSPANLKALDDKADDLERSYLTGLYDLAEGFEEAGQMEKAKQALEGILRLKPDAEGVKNKLRELNEAVFDANSHIVEIDASKGWVATGVFVRKDEPVRFVADGSYKFIANETLGPDGFSNDEVMRDMASGVPAGAVMGLIVPRPKPGQRQPPKPGAPFTIGGSREFDPPEDGVLLLRINVPPGSKCIGKVKVMMSGNIQPTP